MREESLTIQSVLAITACPQDAAGIFRDALIQQLGLLAHPIGDRFSETTTARRLSSPLSTECNVIQGNHYSTQKEILYEDRVKTLCS
jgi:hypothetical protein